MKIYQATFGRYAVRSLANNPEQAKKIILDKISKYKLGSSKGDYIRKNMITDFNVYPVYLKNGFYREI